MFCIDGTMVMMHIAVHCNLFGVLDAVFYCVRLLLQGEGEEEYGEGDGADGEEGEEGDDEEGDDPPADGNALRSPYVPLAWRPSYSHASLLRT